jgi:glycerol-3-phosphate O-acyltransferase/dihydroxyacetone phosphate acyltransferase
LLPISGLFTLKYWVTYRAFWTGRFSGSSARDGELETLRGEMLTVVPGDFY